MLRRDFFGASACATAALTAFNGCERKSPEISGRSLSVLDWDGTLAGRTLEELREQYRYDLFDDFLPFLDRYVIDHEYGGFMCNTDREGNNITTNKNMRYEGRGLWVYSFLYNNIDNNPKYLEVARKSFEFVMKHKPTGDNLWPRGYSREGKVISPPPHETYEDIFFANGVSEYSKAVKDDSLWDFAKGILLKCMRIYDSPDYGIQVYYGPEGAPEMKRQSILGNWMVILRLVTQMLEFKADPEVEAIADRAVDAIMNHHFNPDFGLMNEAIHHDLSRPNNEWAQFCYTGHAIETLWMVLYEAYRRKNRQLFDLTAERIKRHVEVAWDDVYRGVFRSLDHVDKNIWKVDKVLWAQEEVLIGTLFIIEHTGAQWAKDWFTKMFTYIHTKYPLKQYGYSLWILGADRKVTFTKDATRVGNFHHPRHLMLNLLCLDRMIKRGGKVSNYFT